MSRSRHRGARPSRVRTVPGPRLPARTVRPTPSESRTSTTPASTSPRRHTWSTAAATYMARTAAAEEIRICAETTLRDLGHGLAAPPEPASHGRLSGCGVSVDCQAGGVWPAYVGSPSELFEDADDAGGRVELEAVDAVAGTGGITVVHVVPTLAEGDQGQRPEVGGAVVAAGGERTGAQHVAQRVHAPGDVLEQAHAYEPGPDQRGERGVPGAADGQSGEERQREGGDAHQGEGAREPGHRGLGQQVGGVVVPRGRIVSEDPAEVGEQQSAQLAYRSGAVAVGGVGVSGPVAEGVMAAVGRDP